MIEYQQPIQNYWYPAMFLFPDNEAPVVSDFSDVTVGEEAVTVSLVDKVFDADSPNAAIVKSVSSIGDESIVKADIVKGELVLSAKKKGETTVEVTFNSNGKKVAKSIGVKVTKDESSVADADVDGGINVFVVSGGIMITGIDEPQMVEVYNLQGQLVKSEVVENAAVVSGLMKNSIYIVKISNKSYKVVL